MLDKNATILVVDDTLIMRESLRRVLASMGYVNVLQADNGRSALKVLEEKEFKVDLIFLDIVMPFMDGKQTLKSIREKSKTIPVVMLTSVADRDAIVECVKEGITSYVLKPISAANGPEVLSGIFVKL